jgi:hypothetical protein
MRFPNSVLPIGTTGDGSLVVDVAPLASEDRRRLARISPGGATEATGVLPPHDLDKSFVDRDGIAHLVLAGYSEVDYMQVDMTVKGLPVVRRLDYDQSFDAYASAPGYLRWALRRRVKPNEFVFFGGEPGRLMVATPRQDSSGSFFRVYRVVSKTLALIDSGTVSLARDVYRTWSGPAIPRAALVPAGRSGYWLFARTTDTPPSPTVVAYRLGPDLKVIRPAAVEASLVQPFAAAPADAAVSVQCPFTRKERWEDSVWVVPVRLLLSFTAFGGDGQIYSQAFEDSVTSRVTR